MIGWNITVMEMEEVQSLRKRIAVIMLVCALVFQYTGLSVSVDDGVVSENVVQAKSQKVYITPTGKCYHKTKCGRGTYYKVTLKKAKSMGLRPCRKRACYG